MAQLPMMTVSGIRGIVGDTIDTLFISRIAYVQTKLAGGGKIVVGRDTRPSGADFAHAAFRGIRAAGGSPVDIGIAPTPTTCLAVKEIGAQGGIILTASHNPSQYNGYKMVHQSGRLYRADECTTVYDAFRRGKYPAEPELTNTSSAADSELDAAALHLAKILQHINVETVRSANMHIAVDSINGAGGAVFPALLEALGVTWEGVHNKLDGDFVHNPEPRPAYLGDLAALLKSNNKFWGGFVFDPDADRLATMGEQGEPISEEMTLVFALQNLLARQKNDIATNLSTSMLIDDVATRFNCRVVRSKIGEANVVAAMEEHHCAVGGEGNGGVIYPPVVAARDGLMGMALIVELMAKTGMRLTGCAAAWPTYAIVKNKIPCRTTDPAALINRLTAVFSHEKHNLTDGLKIIRDYGWVHLRASNTEPIIRCYAEAKTIAQAEELAHMVMSEAMNS